MTALLVIAALFALVILALIGQDVAFYFLGHQSVTTRILRPPRRIRMRATLVRMGKKP